jgi:hypothetical protein
MNLIQELIDSRSRLFVCPANLNEALEMVVEISKTSTDAASVMSAVQIVLNGIAEQAEQELAE